MNILQFTYDSQTTAQSNGIQTHNHLVRKQTLNHLAKVFVFELNGCGFESRCCHLNFRYHACFEQRFLGIQAIIKCRFTLKRVRDIIITYSKTCNVVNELSMSLMGVFYCQIVFCQNFAPILKTKLKYYIFLWKTLP